MIIYILQNKEKEEYEKKIEKLKKEIKDNEIIFIRKEKELKEVLEQKENEIIKLQTKMKLLSSNIRHNQKNENNTNNNSNLSLLFKSKANSSIYTSSKDDIDTNKYKYDDFYNIYKENQLKDNLLNKNRTMANLNKSRNNNLFTIVNRRNIKKNNINQSNTIININSYLSKNYSTNNLRKNNSSRKRKLNNSNKKQKYKLHFHNNSSFNITNNTYNMNKNNIMINLNPKNVNMNMEKLKVQKKLIEYQRLIDQKLNELIIKKHPNMKNRQAYFDIRQNSSPTIYIRNLKYPQEKYSSIAGIDYYLKKEKKRKLTRNSSELNSIQGNKLVNSKSVVQFIQKRKIHHVLNSKSQCSRNEKINSENINNIKCRLNRENFKSKLNEINDVKQINLKNDNDNELLNENSKIISLRKFIFTKCGKPKLKIINNNNAN